MSKVRTRFAPSPTGYLHVGGVRTALFAWTLAKQNDGEFMLRIEDTDKSREVEGSVQHIQDSLKWLNIEWNEEPVLQSARLDIYREWAQKLVDMGLAYAEPFTTGEVQKFRDQANTQKKPFLYRNYRPENLETSEDWYGKVPLRFKIENPRRIDWHDEVRGDLSAGVEALDDFIIIKADGYPTYNFAHVIDDYLMGISHVMRGEEFISSMPKFIALHEALELPLPKFATMPPILGPTGGKKLSKRDGAKDILEYRDEGYLPSAMMNFLSSLGWNDGTEQEIYTVEEFVNKFSLDRIQRKGAHFDTTKLDWINWQHYVMLIRNDLQSALKATSIQGRLSQEAAELATSKSRSLEEFETQASIFTDAPLYKLTDENLNQISRDLSTETAKKYVQSAIGVLEDIDFSPQQIEDTLRNDMNSQSAQPREYLNLIRWCVSGQKVSPDLFEMLNVLGKEEALKRLKTSAESA